MGCGIISNQRHSEKTKKQTPHGNSTEKPGAAKAFTSCLTTSSLKDFSLDVPGCHVAVASIESEGAARVLPGAQQLLTQDLNQNLTQGRLPDLLTLPDPLDLRRRS